MEELYFELDCEISAPHFHEELEILYVLSGRIATMSSDSNFVLGTEDFIVFNSYEYHEIYRDTDSHVISAYIPVSFLRQADLGRIFCCSRFQSPQNRSVFLSLRSQLALLLQNFLNIASQKSVMLARVFTLLSILESQFEVEEETAPGIKSTRRIQKALRYLGTHFSENISMQEVAEHLFISKSYLSREFQRQMGISFSDYLLRLRLNKAVQLLNASEKSVTDIALACGFSNVNTMILNFRQAFGTTPGVYRKLHGRENSSALSEKGFCGKRPDFSDTSVCQSLLKYADYGKADERLHKKRKLSTVIETDLCHNGEPFVFPSPDTICIGMAISLMNESLRNILRNLSEHIVFRYISFHGLTDDSMGIYQEDLNGRPSFHFTFLDMIFDFLMEIGMKPVVEFGFTPQKLLSSKRNQIENSYVALPDTPAHQEKWQLLVQGIMRHLTDRYGREELSQWRFSAMEASCLFYSFFSVEEYFDYYRKTFYSVRKIFPEAYFLGFGLDIGFLAQNNAAILTQLLEDCIAYDCLPDAFAFQCFHYDYSFLPQEKMKYRNAFQMVQMVIQSAAPDKNPDILRQEILICKKVLEKYGLAGRPIGLSAWNSTLRWDEPGNDTRFKAGFLIKNILENCKELSFLTYFYLMDDAGPKLPMTGMFHGGCGLINHQGIPKAGYYALQLLNMMQQERGCLVRQGEGFLITCSRDRARIQIMLYHYCHDKEQEQTRNFHIYLKGMEKGEYLKRSFYIDKNHGSGYDTWKNMGSPEPKNRTQLAYIINTSTFGVYYESLQVNESNVITFSNHLEEHEVRMILIEKK